VANLCESERFPWLYGTPYNSRSQGMAERTIRTVVSRLRACTEGNYTRWGTFIDKLQACLNDEVSAPTGVTPNMLIFAVNVVPPFSVDVNTHFGFSDEPEGLESPAAVYARIQRIWQSARHIEEASLPEPEAELPQYSVGDTVMVYVGSTQKLDFAWRPCYQVVRTLGDNVYEVVHQNIDNARPMLRHGRYLRSFDETRLDEATRNRLPRPDQSYFVQAILGHRNAGDYNEVLVHWQGFSPHDATWEPADAIRHTQPYLDWLETLRDRIAFNLE
jgi:hypothetical protein